VRLLGERTDVIEILSALDLFAFPSDYEGLGVVLLEALAAGCPVVATAVPGILDVILDGQTGVLVPRGDSAALARAIVKLAREPGRRAALVARGRARVEERFSIVHSATEYQDLYAELLQKRCRPVATSRAPGRQSMLRPSSADLRAGDPVAPIVP